MITRGDRLEIGSHCYLEYHDHCGVSICYDSWYSDGETEVDQAKAGEIIAWLQAKYPELVLNNAVNREINGRPRH